MSRSRLTFFACAGLLLVSFLQSQAAGQTGVTKKLPTLEERLVFGLKARRPSEKKFIKKIVSMVKSGSLKQKTVDESFFWVRKEIEKKKLGDPTARKHVDQFPFFYFERVVKANAKRNGVIIK